MSSEQGRAVGSWLHLARRFLEVATARSLNEFERVAVHTWIGSGESMGLFFAQPVSDQRHAFRAASRVQHTAPERTDLIRAALLHDIGKRHAGFGIIRRSIAGALTKVGLPLSGRYALYVQHGPVGAEELRGIGSEAIVVDFAHHHHDRRPDSIDPDDWRLLMQADQPGKAPGLRPSAIP